MIHLIPTIKGTATILAVMVASGTAAATARIIGEATIGDDSTIKVGLCGVGIGVAWYLASTLQSLKDGQKANSKRLSRIERKLDISEDEDTDDSKI